MISLAKMNECVAAHSYVGPLKKNSRDDWRASRIYCCLVDS